MTDLRRSILDRAKGYEQEAAKTQGTLSAYWRGMAHGLSMAADMVRDEDARASIARSIKAAAEYGESAAETPRGERAGPLAS
jgi:hypothetical protein